MKVDWGLMVEERGGLNGRHVFVLGNVAFAGAGGERDGVSDDVFASVHTVGRLVTRVMGLRVHVGL